MQKISARAKKLVSQFFQFPPPSKRKKNKKSFANDHQSVIKAGTHELYKECEKEM